MTNDNKLIYNCFVETIANLTSFNKDDIEITLSKRSNINIPIVNYHEFIYMNKKYILNKTKLKCLD